MTLGLSAGAEKAIARAIATKRRPPVIWLHFAECTGCTQSLMVSENPALGKLILEMVSLDYHETLGVAAGYQADAIRRASMSANKGKYILIVEGAIPTKDNGIYCKIGGQTAIELLNECAQDAAAVIALGSCAVCGGMPSAKPNPTWCVGVSEVWKASGQHSRLPAQSLQLPVDARPLHHLWLDAGTRQPRAPKVCLFAPYS